MQSIKSLLGIVGSLAFASSLAGALAAAPARYLFLDPAFVREAEGAKLVVNPPKSSEIVIRPDKPWESLVISFYLSVVDEGDKLRMWYICRDKEQGNVAYAESVDGVHWLKPDVGVAEYHGSHANNLVGLRNFCGNVFRDDHATNPQDRYVYVCAVGGGQGGFYRFTSPDGFKWKRDEQPILPFDADSQNVTFWDSRAGKYVTYLRGWNPTKQPVAAGRKVVRFETEHLDRPSGIVPTQPNTRKPVKGQMPEPWVRDELPDALVCDAEDPKDTDIYTNAIQPYPLDPSWYVGFPAFYRHAIGSPLVNDGWTETQFVGSRDGKKWERYNREPYVKPGPAGSESAGMVYIGSGLVVRGDEIWQYGTGFRTTHGMVRSQKQPGDGTIFRHVHRVDGFVSLDFASAGGHALCGSLKVTGSRLLLNLDAGALGALRVGLRDADGKPIPGYGLDDCTPLRGNATGSAVAWRGGDLAALKDREVQVEIAGARAKLYSLRFEP
jgi:hypothetical protein